MRQQVRVSSVAYEHETVFSPWVKCLCPESQVKEGGVDFKKRQLINVGQNVPFNMVA